MNRPRRGDWRHSNGIKGKTERTGMTYVKTALLTKGLSLLIFTTWRKYQIVWFNMLILTLLAIKGQSKDTMGSFADSFLKVTSSLITRSNKSLTLKPGATLYLERS